MLRRRVVPAKHVRPLTPPMATLRRRVRFLPRAASRAPRLLRSINERALLDHLRLVGPRSRAQLARDTGLSKPTVSLALANLERAGLARAVGHLPSSRGRAAVLYEPDPTAAHAVGIDIGRDWFRSRPPLSGSIVARTDARNRARSGPTLVRRVAALPRGRGRGWPDLDTGRAHGGGRARRVLTPRPGRSSTRPTCRAWSRPGVMDALRDALPPSVTLENDANLAALGERTYGSGREANTFVYVSVGTGIGMGIVIDGEPMPGCPRGGGRGGVRADPKLRARQPEGARAGHRGGGGVGRRGGAHREGTGHARVTVGETGFAAARAGDELALATVEREADRLALVVGAVVA